MSDETSSATPKGRWVVTYESQGCYDDGGVGHDDFWTERQHRLDGPFESDEKAVKAAKAWIRKQSGTYPCRGSFCANKGLYRLIDVEHVMPEQRRSARSDTGSDAPPEGAT